MPSQLLLSHALHQASLRRRPPCCPCHTAGQGLGATVYVVDSGIRTTHTVRPPASARLSGVGSARPPCACCRRCPYLQCGLPAAQAGAGCGSSIVARAERKCKAACRPWQPPPIPWNPVGESQAVSYVCFVLPAQDFGGRAVWGTNLVGDGVNNDGMGHGTHVAGLVGGVPPCLLVATRPGRRTPTQPWLGQVSGPRGCPPQVLTPPPHTHLTHTCRWAALPGAWQSKSPWWQ